MKNKVIDIMIQLLEFAKTLPVFSVNFDVKANNEDIETHIISNITPCDEMGKRLSDDELHRVRNLAIMHFRTNVCDPSGVSTLSFSKVYTPSTIKYDDIYKLVSGKDTDLPKNYTFIGNIRKE